jgi:TPR repeat protein
LRTTEIYGQGAAFAVALCNSWGQQNPCDPARLPYTQRHLATMATQDSPSQGNIPQRLVQLTDSPSQPHYQEQEGQKENAVYRKPLPIIPIPTSGRVHDAPMSPVKINVQTEEWAPRPSTAQIEGDGPSMGQDKNTFASQNEQHRPTGASEEVIVQDMPNRQQYTTHTAALVQQPQVATASSMNDVKSKPLCREALYDQEDSSRNTSSPSSDTADASAAMPAIQPLHYHHQQYSEDLGVGATHAAESGEGINRHLTPNSIYGPRSTAPRPASAYSALSDPDPRGGSPGHVQNSPSWSGRSPSANYGGRSPENRPNSYIDLFNVQYPQVPPVPLSFDNSQLRTAVGSNASLLSTAKTLEMYRLNVKKTNDPSIQYAFAVFLISAAQEAGLNEATSPPGKLNRPATARDLDSAHIEKLETPSSSQDLLREARQILSRLADRSYPFAQYYLADGYASGLFNKGKEDYDRAFPLFIAASKHGHAESGYRAALCYEFGWGCRKDPAKAVQFYRQSASKNHPGAMTRLGRACLSGDLGLNKYREGLKWLKRATEAADPQYNAAPYHLGLLYETGYGDDVFQDETYAAQLFTQAADLGHAEASYRLGDAYEHGKLSCPQDPALSVHFYTGAAQQGHPAAMMALCAWYMLGAEPVLEKDENEAYEWARRAAECGELLLLPCSTPSSRTQKIGTNSVFIYPGLTKAEYAVGYFTEMGIGCRRDPLEANVWYVKAADAGDERAKHRLAAIRAAVSGETDAADPKKKMKKSATGKLDTKAKAAGVGEGGNSPKDEKDCVVM